MIRARLLAAWSSLTMPKEGVEENLISVVERKVFYKEKFPLPEDYYQVHRPKRTFKAVLGEAAPSPEFIVVGDE